MSTKKSRVWDFHNQARAIFKENWGLMYVNIAFYCTDLVTCFSVAALVAHLTVMCGLFDRRGKAALTASVKICDDGQHPKARLTDVAIFGFLLYFHFHQAACLQTLS